MSEELKAPRGFHDIFGENLRKFRRITRTVREILKRYNFEEIITPVVEYAHVFERSIGEVTDIVQKEMFVFPDRKGRLLALRPEGTAGVVRAFIEHRLFATGKYYKFFYEGPMFRYERPQAGRYRQFHQIGAEVLGVEDPVADAEIIEIVNEIIERLGVDAQIEINSIGCRKCRPKYREELIKFLNTVSDKLCKDCLERKDRNPLRVLDCKVETCKEAVKDSPKMIDFLCEDCRKHYETLKELLKHMNISFKENYNLVRGLDYYTRTVFEVVSEKLNSTVIAGGRYDYLVEDMGGPPTPALGFAVGIERLSLVVDEEREKEPLYFVIPFGDVKDYALEVAKVLRDSGKRVELSFRKGGLKKQLEYANRIGADYAVIIGEDEKKEGVVSLKNLLTGEQKKVKPEEI